MLVYVQCWVLDPGWVNSRFKEVYVWDDMWLSLRNPKGKHCIRNWFSRMQRDLHFCLFLTKKKKQQNNKPNCEGREECPA